MTHTLQCTYNHGACGYPVSSYILVLLAVPAGSPPRYDLENVCVLHLNKYREWIKAGLAKMLTNDEALVAEVMLS